MKVRNTFAIFIVSGFWHGANWTFIVWGILHAIYFLPLLLTNKNRKNLEIVAQGNTLPTAKEFLQILFTFSLTVFAWIIFRAKDMTHAFSYISGIFSSSLFEIPQLSDPKGAMITMLLIFVFICIEWLGRESQYALEHLGLRWKRPLRHAMYYTIIIALIWFSGKEQQFIYFQF